MNIENNTKLYENFQQVAKELAGVQEGHIENLEKTEGKKEILDGANVTFEEDERHPVDEKGRVNTIHAPSSSVMDNLDLAEKISERLRATSNNLKNSFVDAKKYTGATHAMLKAAGVNITATTKVFFNIFSLMQLMLETAQRQRTAGREMRNAELLATTASIERQADKQIEAATERRNAAMVSAAFSIGVGSVSVGTSAFGAASAAAASTTESAAGTISDMAQEVIDSANDVSDLSKNVSDLSDEVGNLSKSVSELSQKTQPQFIDETIGNGNMAVKEGQKKLSDLDKFEKLATESQVQDPNFNAKVEGAGLDVGSDAQKIKFKPDSINNGEVKGDGSGIGNGEQKIDANSKPIDNNDKVESKGSGIGSGEQKNELNIKLKEDASAGDVNKQKSVHPDKLADDLSNDKEFLEAKNTVEEWRISGAKGKPPENVVAAAHKLKQASTILTKQAKMGFARQTALKGITEGLTGISKGMGDILAASINMKAEMIQAEATREQVNQKFAEAAMQDAVEAMQTAQEVINTVIRSMLQILTSQVEMMKQLHFA